MALQGYDGFLYSVGFLVAWLVALLLTAELMRNIGRFTLADVLSYRLKQRPVRVAAATSSLAVSFFYLLAQMAGAGGLVALLLGLNSLWAQYLVIAVVGAVMIGYVLIGGMKGTTWVQMIKAVLLIGATTIITVWVLGKYGFNLSGLLQSAADNSPDGAALLDPGLRYGGSTLSKIDFISLSMALVFGTAGLPHVLIRFYTVPTSKQARKSVEWAIWLIGGFYLLTLVVGYGAAALVGPDAIKAAPGAANSAAPLLAYELGGSWMLGIISGIAFATILAVVAGLTIASSATFAHDLYNYVFRNGQATPDEEVKVARWAAVGIGVVAIVGGILAYGQNIAFLVALAFAVAASANLPTILYSLFWSRFNTRGALWSIYGGLASALLLIAFSPVVSGSETSMITNPNVDFSFFPLANPGIISIPLGFFLGWLGTVTHQESNAQKWAEVEVKSLTGHGVAESIEH
jgi:cation/acetate symporter